MIFLHEPNMVVRISHPILKRIIQQKYIKFDENGEYETDNEFLIKAFKQNFKVKEEEKTVIEVPKTRAEQKVATKRNRQRKSR